MAKYNIYHGKFRCQDCGSEVTSLRSYPETKELTWMCQDKHMSRVDLNTKKNKKDYEREERE
jgi:transposase-like protein